MPTPPRLTDEQRRQAYEKALELRRLRAQLKRELGAGGELTFGQVWIHKAAQGMKVIDLLTALPGVRVTKATKILELAGIPTKNTVRATGPRQRERLFALLDTKKPRR